MAKSQEVITFKADAALLKLMQGVQNRSEFIRTAILNALDSSCPVCKGSGVLSAASLKHWEEFSKTHSLKECGHCDETKMECSK